MFTEYELESMVEIPEILAATQALKKDFIKKEAPYLEVTDHDFFSLIMMSPMIGVAMADGSISFFEERSLNKKARKLSKGGYFMKKDPVVYAMQFLIKKFDGWGDKFYAVLKIAIESSFHYEGIQKENINESTTVSYDEYKKTVLRQPYILIRFIASFFLENDEEIISSERTMGKTEHVNMLQIGEKLGLTEIPVFQMFCKTFEIKG
ncbi:MAG: hypothetical protein ACI8QD_000215 [Cyclobacteriaceae bacterium]|jgi:hypothetical protein